MKNFTPKATLTIDTKYDEAFRKYMIGVFNNMSIALIITAITSYGMISTGMIGYLFATTPQGKVGLSALGYLALFSPLIFVLSFGTRLYTMRPERALLALWLYAVLMGISISPILIAYTGASVIKVFFITASLFGAMSIYGYTTKRDLTVMGSFLFMGLIGIIIASIVNMFLASPAIDFITSIIAVIIFTGLTAFDVQRIAEYYQIAPDETAVNRFSIIGALSLYIDFINLFLSLLRIFGERDERR